MMASVMIATPLVLSNLMYLVGAIVLAVVISVIYVLWHRRPQSLEDGMASFTKGLQALAPERSPHGPQGRPTPLGTWPVATGGRVGAADHHDRRRPPVMPPRSRATPAVRRLPAEPDPVHLRAAPPSARDRSPESHAG